MPNFDKIKINGTPYMVHDTETATALSAETQARQQAIQQVESKMDQAVEDLTQKIDEVPRAYRQYRNVLEYGADPSGVNSSTSAFNSAFAAGGVVFVPKGEYLIPGLTVPDNVNIIIDRNTTFTPETLPSSTEEQIFYATGAPGENVTPWAFIRENNNFTPGTDRGYVKYGVLFKESNNNPSDPFFHWNVVAQTINSTSNDAENVGIYSQMVDKNDGRVWAICTDTQDPTDGNPTQQKYGIEIGFNCGGQDNNNLRVPLHISLSRKQGATGGVCSRAMLISSDGTQEMSFTRVFDIKDVKISGLFNFSNVTVDGSFIDLSQVKASAHGITMGQNDIQMGRFTIRQGNSDTQLFFQIDGTTVGYIDASGWHNGTP